MELQLSLSLPIYTPATGFDINSNVEFEPDDLLSGVGGCSKEINGHYEHGGVVERFPLVSWNGDPNEEDGSDEEGRKGNSDSSNGDYKETNFIDGWPPINSWRKNMFLEHQGGQIADGPRRVGRGGDNGCRMNSIFVKVKMEGVAIGRKIDLNLYHSYQMLTMELFNMFAKYQEDDNDGAGYILLYQDKEGNWLLAGQVPWQTFVESVRRMEIIRSHRGRS